MTGKRKKPATAKKSATRKRLAAQYFDNMCYVCRRTYGKWFAIHHLGYLPDGQDVLRKDFNSAEKYNVALEPMIARELERFALLCRNDHFLIGWVSALDDDQYMRLTELRARMKHYQNMLDTK